MVRLTLLLLPFALRSPLHDPIVICSYVVEGCTSPIRDRPNCSLRLQECTMRRANQRTVLNSLAR